MSQMEKNLKVGALTAISVVSISTAYYFALFLPSHMTDKETHRRAVECTVLCEAYEKKLTPGDVAFSTEYHYNSKLDKCFLYALSASSDSRGRFTEETIYDVNENTVVSSYNRNDSIPADDFDRRMSKSFRYERTKLFELKQTSTILKWLRLNYKRVVRAFIQEPHNRTKTPSPPTGYEETG